MGAGVEVGGETGTGAAGEDDGVVGGDCGAGEAVGGVLGDPSSWAATKPAATRKMRARTITWRAMLIVFICGCNSRT